MSNIPNLALMIRPKSFGFNSQTAGSNSFQQTIEGENISQKAILEFDAMVGQLIDYQIPVKVFDDQKSGLPDSVFPNNWIAQMPAGDVFVFPMFSANRRAEIRKDIIDYLESLKGNSVIDLSNYVEKEMFLEGTGSMVIDYGHKTAFACESPRTNIQLFDKFCDIAGYEPFSFSSFDLKGAPIYHTNVMMAVANDYALVCLESVQDLLEQNMLKKKLSANGKQVIPISYQQMNSFAGNALELLNSQGESHLVISKTAYDSLGTDQILAIEKYSTIVPISIPFIEKVGGGSVRCMIAGIFS